MCSHSGCLWPPKYRETQTSRSAFLPMSLQQGDYDYRSKRISPSVSWPYIRVEVIMVLRGEHGAAAFPGTSRNRDGFARSSTVSGCVSLGSRLDTAWAPQRCRSSTQPGYETPSSHCDTHSKRTVDHRAML